MNQTPGAQNSLTRPRKRLGNLRKNLMKMTAIAGATAVGFTMLPQAAHAEFVHREGQLVATNADGSVRMIDTAGFEKPTAIDSSSAVAYCVNLGLYRPNVTTQFVKGAVVEGETAARLAYIMDKYGDNTDVDSTSAVQFLAHMNYDVNGTEAGGNNQVPAALRDLDGDGVPEPENTDTVSGPTTIDGRRAELNTLFREQRPTAAALADQYWADAVANSGPYTAVGTLPTTTANDSTAVISGVGVRSAAGNLVAGEPVTLTLTGPATFADGTQTMTLTTGTTPQDVPITITGYGQISLTSATTPAPASLQLWNPTTFNDDSERPGVAGFESQVVITGINRVSASQQSTLAVAPTLRTSAVDTGDGDKFIAREGGSVTDRVTYANLVVGKEVTVRGTLMDQATGQSTGITAETTFTPTSANETVDVVFNNLPAELAGKTLVVFEEMLSDGAVIAEHKDINDQAQTVAVTGNLQTSATDAADGDKNITQAGGVVNDVVTYTNLKPETQYEVTGELMDKATGQSTGITNTVTFTTPAATGGAIGVNGTVTIPFTIPADAVGKTLVAFETVREVGVEGVIADHRDLNDADQTVFVSKIGTTARDASDGDKFVADQNGQIIDTISFENLVPGTEYTVEGTLMDKATGESTGITASMKFTPETATGTVDLPFTLTDAVKGKTLVAFEKVLNPDGSVQGTHEDINDEAQTVFVSKIGTIATDAADGDKVIAYKDGTLVDTIKYENLAAGVEYTASGRLMEKVTREDGTVEAVDTGVTAETKFTPEAANGEVKVEFALPAELEGKTIVVFEQVTNPDGSVQATHEDINDVDQTVFVSKIRTTLADDADSDQTVAYKDGTVTDTVTFTNLVVGQEYTFEGELMEKVTAEDGTVTAKPTGIKATSKYTPTETSGSVDLTFTLPAEAEGKTLVAFEKVLNPDLTIQAAHEDINDTAQTVFVSKIRTTATDSADGDKSVTFKGGKVTDVISYTNLVKGAEYTVSGELVEKVVGADGKVEAKPTGVTATKTFTAEDVNGTVNLDFALTDELEGKTLVVFEKVTNSDGSVQAAHEDISDEAQTVYVSQIRTFASDAGDGDKTLAEGDKLKDVVMYTGLEPGMEYTIKGEVMNQATGQSTGVTAEAKFTPESRNGSTELLFDLSKIAGTTGNLVVFETLLNAEGKVQAEHKDIKDAAQTVEVVVTPKKPNEPVITRTDVSRGNVYPNTPSSGAGNGGAGNGGGFAAATGAGVATAGFGSDNAFLAAGGAAMIVGSALLLKRRGKGAAPRA